MGRAIRRVIWTVAALAGLSLLAVVLVLVAVNTQPGRERAVQAVATLTAGEIKLTGLSGRFPDALRLGRLELRDAGGLWLTADGLALDWSPLRLLAGTAEIGRLEAEHIALDRLPASPPEAEPASSPTLPVGVTLHRLHVARLDLAQAVAGQAASLAIEGSARLATLEQGEAELTLRRLDGEGTYALRGRLDQALVNAQLSLREPAQGLLATFADLPGLDALSAEAAVEGPLSALQTRLDLALGPFQAKLQGQLDWVRASADVTVSARAPAMQPRPGLSWQAVTLDAQVRGPFTRPAAEGTLRIDGLHAADTAVRSISMDLQGDAGEVRLTGQFAGVRLPGPQPGLLESAPLALQASMRLDAASRPLAFTLKHPLVAVEGTADTAAALRGELVLNLPDLKPFAALGGLDAQGSTTLKLRAASQGETATLEVDGTLGLTGGNPVFVSLLGNAAKLGVSATWRGDDIGLPRFALDGKALGVLADGTLTKQNAHFNWKLSLKDLAAVMAGASGQLAAQGQIEGPVDNYAVTAELSGELATRELPRGPIAAKIRLDGLPGAPSGQLTVRGALGGAPLDVALNAKAPADGGLQVVIDSATWKSAQAKGSVTLPKGSAVPIGKIDLGMARLEDLRPFLGQPVSGRVEATLEMSQRGNRPVAQVRVDARQAGLADAATVAQASLTATVFDPVDHPVIDGRINVDGILAGAWSGSAQLGLAGPLEALKLRLSAALQNGDGTESSLGAAAVLDVPAKQATVAELRAGWKGESLNLLQPVRIRFADGLAVDRLRLGLRQAELAVAGRVSPTLALTATLDNLPVELVRLFAPDPPATGSLQAEASLTGTPAHPVGSVAIEAKDLRLQTGAGRALPPARLAATARLDGASAQVDTRLSAGGNLNLGITGEVPLARGGPLSLRATGGMDLQLLDPWLTAQGRRLRGQLALNGDLGGTLSAPRATGSVQLGGGEMQDFDIGAHLTHITALLQAEGGVVRLAKFEGRAGPGTVSASGSVDVLGEGMPVNLTLTARKARPLAGDRMTVNLNADLAVSGQVAGQLAVAGAVHINRAEIRIPERMPAKLAVLNVRRPGVPPPPPPAPGPDVTLDLTMDAPGEIFVRGRGLDAELGGKVHVRGTADKPQPDGGFAMRRGQFALAGKTLTFSKGEVGFDGGSLADPSLNFIANTTSGNVTATLGISGNASNPKIKLSSEPELPPDEVLARLLFGRSATSLSALEMVQIASAVAALTGLTSGVGDPLESVRAKLGLDRLSIGGASPALEAGRYVAPGVYVGAKQGVTGTGTQATVQIDITQGLKVEGTAGTGTPSASAPGTSGTNSVGVIYQHEY